MRDNERFWLDYFIQTRKEIDTEKQERDKILNYAFLVMGAIGFAVAQKEEAQKFLRTDEGLVVAGAALLILFSLFWVRRKKLQQIADRWYVLRHQLQERVEADKLPFTLESVVAQKLPTRTYTIKDAGLSVALALPIYVLFGIRSYAGLDRASVWQVVTPITVILGHLGVSLFILMRRLKNPLEGLEETGLTGKSGDSAEGAIS